MTGCLVFYCLAVVFSSSLHLAQIGASFGSFYSHDMEKLSITGVLW